MFICSKKTYNSPYLIEYLVAHYTGKYSLELLTNLCQDSMIPFLIIKSDMDLVEELSQLISRNSYPSSVSIYTNNQHLIEAGNKFRIYIQKNTFDSFVGFIFLLCSAMVMNMQNLGCADGVSAVVVSG
jgi:hypothetical protein